MTTLKRRPVYRRPLYLAVFGVMLIGVALGYVHFYLYLPMGTGPAGPAVPADAFQRPWTDRQVLLVGLGDSVTAGLGTSRGDLSYFRRLEKNPPGEFADMQGRCLSAVLPNLSTLNLAVSGSNSSQHLDRIRAELTPQPDDVFGIVVMTSGGNDLIHWYGRSTPKENAMYGATLAQAQPWIANFEQRLDEMITLIEQQFPGGCLIFLADIYDPSDGAGDPESAWLPAWPDCLAIHSAYNNVIQRVATRHSTVRVVPMHRTFLGHGIHCRKFWRQHFDAADPHYWYAFNLEDPNDRGYDAARRAFLMAIISERAQIAGEGR
jgi:lysophospholipase L1-like esterase